MLTFCYIVAMYILGTFIGYRWGYGNGYDVGWFVGHQAACKLIGKP